LDLKRGDKGIMMFCGGGLVLILDFGLPILDWEK
jgi:hypothetical protein